MVSSYTITKAYDLLVFTLLMAMGSQAVGGFHSSDMVLSLCNIIKADFVVITLKFRINFQ